MSKNAKKPRIFIGFSNPAGIGTAYADALRELGYRVSHVTYWPHGFGYEKNEQDFSLNLNKKPKILRQIYLGIFFLKAIFRYDVFIFLFGDTFFLFKNRFFANPDLPILKIFGKKMVMVFVGCDIRPRTADTYSCSGCQVKCDNRLKQKVAESAQKYGNLILAQPDYVQLLKRKKYHRFWIPVNLAQYQPTYQVNKKPAVVHAPSHRGLKGTSYLQEAVRRLKKEGFSFTFKLLENKSHDQVIREISRSDIVVDSLFGGWYGVFSVESLAHGKVVLGYISPQNIKLNQLTPPMISVKPETIYAELKKVLQMKPDERIKLGRKARLFIEQNHDEKKIVSAILKKTVKK